MVDLTTERFSAWSRALRDSDQRAYTELFEATYSGLFRYACYITRNEQVAYDVLQDVYMKLWQIRGKLDPARSLKALLYMMVRNCALNAMRRSANQKEISLEAGVDFYPSPSQQDLQYEADQLNKQIRAWIMELPKRRREAFLLSRYEELSHVEVAEVMGVAPKTVNNHIVLALSHLRSRLHMYLREPVTL